jgi:hypothetical protein
MVSSELEMMAGTSFSSTTTMANSKYAYVRSFELPDPILPDTFMVFRLDGHSFHRWD